jgi:hypothetical protein
LTARVSAQGQNRLALKHSPFVALGWGDYISGRVRRSIFDGALSGLSSVSHIAEVIFADFHMGGHKGQLVLIVVLLPSAMALGKTPFPSPGDSCCLLLQMNPHKSKPGRLSVAHTQPSTTWGSHPVTETHGSTSPTLQGGPKAPRILLKPRGTTEWEPQVQGLLVPAPQRWAVANKSSGEAVGSHCFLSPYPLGTMASGC